MSSEALWYFSRGTGLVALLGLTCTMLLGVRSVSRVSSPRWPRFVTQGLHRNLALLTMTMLGLHIVTVVVDTYVSIGWADAVVPFRAGYHPVWVGLGTVAGDLMLALVVTSLLRLRLGYRTWRAVHWAAYAVWPVSVAHGLGVGSDSGIAWAQILTWSCVAAVVVAAGSRLVTAGRRRASTPRMPERATAAGRA